MKIVTITLLACLAIPALAQQDRVIAYQAVEAGAVRGHPPADVMFVASEFAWESRNVKGAPYSAETITETSQALADGNRITRKSSGLLYRDGEGRTRREHSLDAVGPWATGKIHKLISIEDPVAGVHWMLEPEAKIARKITLKKGAGGFGVATAGVRVPAPLPDHFDLPIPAEGPGEIRIERGMKIEARAAPAGDSKIEQLGKRNIEGLICEGSKTTITIPAGQIGNERPIEIVAERWYSPELQTVVLTRRSDPRTGETTFRLASVRRGEPGRNLFEPPPDYTVKEDGPGLRIERKIEAKEE